jgi:hypothetical protein
MDARWLVTPKEGDRYPLGPPVFTDVAQRKSIRLISERPTFRNCPSVPVLGACSLQRTVNPLPLIEGWLADGSIPSGSTSCQHI